jgi:hypothetical protein
MAEETQRFRRTTVAAAALLAATAASAMVLVPALAHFLLPHASVRSTDAAPEFFIPRSPA